jgi:hypothetical protein
MVWREGAALVIRLGSPMVLIGAITWLVALFGSNRYSERAMRLLRRPPLQPPPATPGLRPPDCHTPQQHDGRIKIRARRGKTLPLPHSHRHNP